MSLIRTESDDPISSTASNVSLLIVVYNDELIRVIKKADKTRDDAKHIFTYLKRFPFLDNFLSQNAQDMDINSVLTLFQNFNYEKFSAEEVIFKQRDPTNNKFYIVLSGEVAVIIDTPQLGNFDGKNKSPRQTVTSQTTGSTIIKPLKRQDCNSNEDIDLSPTVLKNTKSEIQRRGTQRLKTFGSSDFNKFERSKSYLTKTIFTSGFAPRTPVQDESPNSSRMREVQQIAMTEPNEEDILASTRASPRNLTQRPDYQSKGSLLKRSTKTLNIISKASTMADDIGESKISPVQTCLTKDLRLNLLGSKMDENLIQEHEGGENDIEDLEDKDSKSHFQRLASRYGKIVRFLKDGEGFGDIALKRNIPRTATILCKKDCEVLTLTKEIYEQTIGRLQIEKEEVLDEVIPQLRTDIASLQNYSYLIYSFRTERYRKGTYIIKEGKAKEEDPKLYIVQTGECILEKQSIKSLQDPFNPHKVITTISEQNQISKAGRGVIFGDEILQNEGEYDYSVRVLSDTVTVQVITKKLFVERFPADFATSLIKAYQKKKQYRDELLGKKLKDGDLKVENYKNDAVYALKNKGIKDYLVRPSIQGFSRHLNREILIEEKDHSSLEVPSPHRVMRSPQLSLIPSVVPASPKERLSRVDDITESIVDTEEDQKNDRKNRMVMLRVKFGNTLNEKMMSKIAYINKMDYQKPKPYNKETDTLFTLPKQARPRPSKCNLTPRSTKEMKQITFLESQKTLEPIESVYVPKIDVREFELALLTSTKTNEFQSPISPRSSHNKASSAEPNSFKSLYVQNLIKGPTSPKLASLRANHFTAFTETSMGRQNTNSPERDVPNVALGTYTSFTKAIQDVTGNSGLENKKVVPSNNMKLEMSNERLYTVSPRSVSISPTYQIHSKAASTIEKFNILEARKSQQSIAAGGSTARETKERSPANAHLHEIKEWRSKIFKKPANAVLNKKISIVKKVTEASEKNFPK